MTSSYSGPLWHVAVVESRSEIRVAQDIHDTLTYPVFVPAEKVWRAYRGRRIEACKPLFQGYIFPCVDPNRQDWQRLLDIDGVLDVLGRPAADDTHARPSYVPSAWVEAMRKAQDMGVFDRTKRTPDLFAIGEEVRVGEGAFSGFNGVITEFVAKMRSATARKRAKLLVQFMGRMSAVEMDVTQLEKL